MFAANAGMYPDFQPVGLRVEEYKEIVELNEAQGFGNFYAAKWRLHGMINML